MFLNLSSIISFKTFQAEGSEWKRFGKIFFLLTGGSVLILAAILECVSWRVGQTIPYDEAAQEQIKNSALIWNEGDSEQAAFKLIRMQQARPGVIVIGQSRMSQFRSAMFRPYGFYNLGQIAWTFSVYSDLLRQLPADYSPKIVFFSLDFFNLNPRYLADYAMAPPGHGGSGWLGHLDAWREIYSIVSIHPDAIMAGRSDARGEPCIGLRAAYYGEGVRLDGSEAQPFRALNTAGRNPDLFHTVQWDHPPIYYGDAVSDEEMAKLEKFIAQVRAHGATPVGVQMPIYGPVLRAIEHNPRYGIWKDFQNRIGGGYFNRLGLIVFDYSKFPPYSDDYRYFIDAFHPTEAVCAATLLKMSGDPRVRAVLPVLDTASLQRKLEEDRNADQHVYLYRNEF
ncbi:MAG TPA: hypothetical protein VL981_02815 [Candidatus Methylacidiphilales bacterium]|nr:hypothetical protein [Candidatus Methylacidiphilales bacterium]